MISRKQLWPTRGFFDSINASITRLNPLNFPTSWSFNVSFITRFFLRSDVTISTIIESWRVTIFYYNFILIIRKNLSEIILILYQNLLKAYLILRIIKRPYFRKCIPDFLVQYIFYHWVTASLQSKRKFLSDICFITRVLDRLGLYPLRHFWLGWKCFKM